MKRNVRLHYYVEGECEQKLLDVLKRQKDQILPGKIEVFNVVNEELSEVRLRLLSEKTIVVLLFDTDTTDAGILKRNIAKLSKNSHVQEIWRVVQVKNLEDELLRSTDVKRIEDLIGCKTEKEFKHCFIIEKNLSEKLKYHQFDLKTIWTQTPEKPFDFLTNDGYKIKQS